MYWFVQAYLAAAAVVTLGALWYRVLRPMLEDFGILPPLGARQVSRVFPPEPGPAGGVMSRSAGDAAPSGPSVSQTDGPDGQTDGADGPPSAAKLLPLYRLLRQEGGATREAARAALAAAALPLDNNVWTQAAPPEPAARARQIVVQQRGQATAIPALPRRQGPWYDDPRLEYQPPDA